MGRVLVTFAKQHDEQLPANTLGHGDIVQIVCHGPGADASAAESKQKGDSGVVWRSTAKSITVALDDFPERGLQDPLSLIRLANDVTYKRYHEALDTLDAIAASGSAAGMFSFVRSFVRVLVREQSKKEAYHIAYCALLGSSFRVFLFFFISVSSYPQFHFNCSI